MGCRSSSMYAAPNPPAIAGEPAARALIPYSVSMPITRACRRAAGSGGGGTDPSSSAEDMGLSVISLPCASGQPWWRMPPAWSRLPRSAAATTPKDSTCSGSPAPPGRSWPAPPSACWPAEPGATRPRSAPAFRCGSGPWPAGCCSAPRPAAASSSRSLSSPPPCSPSSCSAGACSPGLRVRVATSSARRALPNAGRARCSERAARRRTYVYMGSARLTQVATCVKRQQPMYT